MGVRKLATLTGTVVVVGGVGFGTAYAVNSLATDSGTAKTSSSEASPTDARTNCDNLSTEIADREIKVYDHATGADAKRRYGDLCYEAADKAAPYGVQKLAGLTAHYTYENGAVRVTYHESWKTFQTTPDGGRIAVWNESRDAVSQAEAERRLADAAAQLGE